MNQFSAKVSKVIFATNSPMTNFVSVLLLPKLGFMVFQ